VFLHVTCNFEPRQQQTLACVACDGCGRDAAADGKQAQVVAISVIALTWIANVICIIPAANACRFGAGYFAAVALLLGPLAWIVFGNRLKHLPPGRVALLPSPLRKVTLFHTVLQ
jgi:hypothetical protein